MGRVITRVALIGPVCCGQNQGALVRKDMVLAKGGLGEQQFEQDAQSSLLRYHHDHSATICFSGAEFSPTFAHSLFERSFPKASLLWFPSLRQTPHPTPASPLTLHRRERMYYCI